MNLIPQQFRPPSSPVRSEPEKFWAIFACAAEDLNGQIFRATFPAMQDWVIRGMPALPGAPSWYQGALTAEAARSILRARGFAGEGPVLSIVGLSPVPRPGKSRQRM